MTDNELAGLVKAATPGPWAAFGQLWYATIATANDNGEHRICFMSHSNGLNEPRDEANAALIAMAPDLAAEVLALRAANASLLAANQAMMSRIDAIRAESLAEARREVGDRLAQWQPMPAPNDVDILVIMSSGEIQFITKDYNDYNWGDAASYANSGPYMSFPLGWMLADTARAWLGGAK